jgi:uncharacterized OB-fold protein
MAVLHVSGEQLPTESYRKPRPVIGELNRPFWDALAEHRLEVQRCDECGALRFPIGPVCPECLSGRFGWRELSGRGTVLSWVVFRRAYDPAFEEDVPYNVALIELEEDVRMFSNIVGASLEEIEVDMEVEVVFDDVAPDLTLPRFQPRAA